MIVSVRGQGLAVAAGNRPGGSAPEGGRGSASGHEPGGGRPRFWRDAPSSRTMGVYGPREGEQCAAGEAAWAPRRDPVGRERGRLGEASNRQPDAGPAFAQVLPVDAGGGEGPDRGGVRALSFHLDDWAVPEGLGVHAPEADSPRLRAEAGGSPAVAERDLSRHPGTGAAGKGRDLLGR